MVPGDVVGNGSEERCQCSRIAAHSWLGLGFTSSDEPWYGRVEIGSPERSKWTRRSSAESRAEEAADTWEPRLWWWLPLQVNGKGIGRIRLRCIPDASSRSLHAFVKEVLEPGSTAITDGWEGYEGLKDLGYKHKPRIVSGSGKTASTLLPRVHRVASLLKRWLLGTHQGRVERTQ